MAKDSTAKDAVTGARGTTDTAIGTKGTVGTTDALLAMARYSYQQEKDRSVELRSLAMGLLTVAALVAVALAVLSPRVLAYFDAYLEGWVENALLITIVVLFGLDVVSAILSITAIMQIGHETLATPQELRARASVADIDGTDGSQRTFMHDLTGSLQAPFDALCGRNFAIANLVRTSESFLLATFAATLATAIVFLILWFVF